ncbi:MAG: TIGR01777 family oxidoreductase [Candidatus Binatia bacterium]
MHILVSGSSGLIGGELTRRLERGGHSVTRLIRRAPAGGHEVFWDPKAGRLEPSALKGVDAVIHLAGENVAAGRWSSQRKGEIRESRVASTRILAERLSALDAPPGVLIAASAIGFYGDSGEAERTESSGAGSGFLAEVCRAWEAACEPASRRGIRVANLRFGLVVTPDGGALARMVPAFKIGLGGRLGDGRQWMSWVTLDDAIGAIEWVLEDDDLRGPLNVVSPSPVRQAEFAATLGRVLHRPTLLPMPASVLRFLLGEMADELLLASTRAVPRTLIERRYRFRHPQLEPALRSLLSG